MSTLNPMKAGKRSLLRVDRTLDLLDVENLCGTPSFTEDDLIDLQLRYTDLIPIGPSDLVILAASHHRTRELLFGWTDARHPFRSGPDGADLCLLEVIEKEDVEGRFSRVVIGSGDGIFQPACEYLEAHRSKLTLVSRNLRSIAWSLKQAVKDVRTLASPVGTQHGPSRRITVKPLRQPRRFPDRPDPKPRRSPSSPPPQEPSRQPVRR